MTSIDPILDELDARLQDLSTALAGDNPEAVGTCADRLLEAVGAVKLAARPLLPALPESAQARLRSAKALIRAQHEALARAQAQVAREMNVLMPDAEPAGYGRQGAVSAYSAGAGVSGGRSIAA